MLPLADCHTLHVSLTYLTASFSSLALLPREGSLASICSVGLDWRRWIVVDKWRGARIAELNWKAKKRVDEFLISSNIIDGKRIEVVVHVHQFSGQKDDAV